MRRGHAVAALAVVAGLGVASVAAGGADPAKATRVRSQAARTRLSAKAALDKRVAFSFQKTPLIDVVDFLRQVVRTNFVVDQGALPLRKHTVTLTLKNVRLRSALNHVCGTRLGWVVRDEVTYISTRDRLAAYRKARAGRKLRKGRSRPTCSIESALARPVEFSFEGVPMRDVVNFLRQVLQQNVVLDHSAVSPDRVVTMTLAGVRLESALNLLFEGDLDWTVADGAIVISTTAKVKELRRRVPRPSEALASAPEGIRKAVVKEVDFSFEGTPLVDVVSFLQTVVKENIVLRGVPPASKRVVSLHLRKVPLESALNLICFTQPGRLEWAVRDEAICVGIAAH